MGEHVNTPQSLHARIGEELGTSGWVEITQDMVNRFADLTDDHQFIHVDPVAAARTPFGGTVAHGFLTLSLLAGLAKDLDITLQGSVMGVNYGFDRVRMIAPVRVGKRIRGRFVLKDLNQRVPGQWLMTLAVSVEIEGETKPALSAEWLALQYLQ